MHLFKDSLNVIKLVKFEDQQSSAMRNKAKGLTKNNKICAYMRFWGLRCALCYELKYSEDKTAAGIKTKLASVQSTSKPRGIITSLEILLVWKEKKVETDFC